MKLFWTVVKSSCVAKRLPRTENASFNTRQRQPGEFPLPEHWRIADAGSAPAAIEKYLCHQTAESHIR